MARLFLARSYSTKWAIVIGMAVIISLTLTALLSMRGSDQTLAASADKTNNTKQICKPDPRYSKPASATAPPAPRPVKPGSNFDEEAGARCGGDCVHQYLECVPGAVLQADSACCFRCCWSGTSNCSSQYCCPPLGN